VAWGPGGVTAVERAGDPDGFETEYRLRHGRSVGRVPEMPARLADQVQRRLRGERTSGPPLDLRSLTEFEQAVLRKTMEIPFGEVRPYSWVAREIARPRAVRAVGSALAGNPVPFVIPCHRVVRADGHIGQYGAGGPEAKRAVLGVEGVDTATLERLAGSGVRFTGSDTTGIYCYPSCRHARRTSSVHTVAFRTAEEAIGAGYRPCRVCRPLEMTPFAA
jgi:O-6-methylguanine DNA methyltransferase